ncbi:hypothetical protein LOK49_LG10G00910 [Camellia lanceoleosa]|uniref:Uncharacterized protein n=1 Tax=Camellia lanceoleosa TaxID=1840588 RepID=A0ACC0GEU4_9ERIC|nr:hypothetical protein LOK49_LG10G00910 [Camellia lanceoleosa]
MNVIHGKDHSPCNSIEAVGTVVEDSQWSRPTAVGSEQTMMEERVLYPTCNDQPQRYDEQASPSVISKSMDEFGPGINLEVNLGCPNFEHIIQGPTPGINLEVSLGHPNHNTNADVNLGHPNHNTNIEIIAHDPISSSIGLLGSKPGLIPLSP